MKHVTELFRFAEAGVDPVAQTSGNVEVSYGGLDYEPWPISRTQVESKNEISRAGIEVRMDLSNPIAQRYLADPVDVVVVLTIFRQVDEDGVVTTTTFWKGRLAAVKASNKKVTLTFESVFTSMKRPGLRARYQRACRHGLYARGCTLDPEAFSIDVNALSTAGAVVVVDSVAGAPDNRFRGGMLRGPDNVVRFIVKQVGTTLTLSRQYLVLNQAVADGPTAIKLYPGCAHNMEDCLGVFNNLDNYGGFPWLPNRNPFDGHSII